jgi:mRNA interferase MazF
LTRGEIWWATLPGPWGRRPVLLLARNEAYEFLNWVVAAPLTTRVFAVPTQVLLDPATDGVPRPSAISVDNMQAVRKDWLESRITRLTDERMLEVEAAIHFAIALKT